MSGDLIKDEGGIQEIGIQDIKAIVQVPKEEVLPEECAYKVVTAEDEEFYTKTIPSMMADGTLFLFNAIQKCTAEVMILNTKLEQYYSVEVNDVYVPLDEGIILKKVPISELTWFNATEEMAKGILKDEELMYYQTVVPELMRKVSILESRIPDDEHLKVRRQTDFKL